MIIVLIYVVSPLRSRFDPPISVKHMKNSVLRVERFVLFRQILIHLVVGCAEIVDVWLVRSRTYAQMRNITEARYT